MNLLFNKTGGIFMSPSELIEHYVQSCEEMANLGHIKVLETQYDLYKNFILKVTNVDIDINPEKDPFYSVTGFPFRKFYLEKHESNKEQYSLIISPTFDFLSAEHLLHWNLRKDAPREETDRYLKISDKVMARFSLIGETLIDKERDWVMNFTPISFSIHVDETTKLHPHKAVIFLEMEPLEHLKQHHTFNEIYSILKTAGMLFNHDMDGHGTVDLSSHSIEGRIFSNLEKEELLDPYEEIYWKKNTDPGVSKIWFDERRIIGQHLELANVIRKRSSMGRVLRIQTTRFIRLIFKAFMDTFINTAELEYFVKIYLYCLLRTYPWDIVRRICKEHYLQSMLDELLDLNPTESNLQYILYKNTGAPYVKASDHVETADIHIDSLQYIDHKTFYTNIYKRLFA